MISRLEQYAALRRVEFDTVFQVGHSGNVYSYASRSDIPPVPTVWHDDELDMLIDDLPYTDHPEWECVTVGYTGQYGYNGPVMHASEFIGGALADDIVIRPGYYVVCEVSAYPDGYVDGDDVVEYDTAGWTILRWKGND